MRTKNGHQILPLLLAIPMISGVIEKKMRIKNTRVKVRSFPGAKINDFYHYLAPLLKKEPDTVIFHCGTNDIIDKNPEEILDGLLQLKTYTFIIAICKCGYFTAYNP